MGYIIIMKKYSSCFPANIMIGESLSLLSNNEDLSRGNLFLMEQRKKKISKSKKV